MVNNDFTNVLDQSNTEGYGKIREFASGATRDTDEGKLDFDGFFSPTVLVHFAEYMHRHRTQSDGSLRDSDNWQAGIPRDAYMKSMWRHFFDVWAMHHDRECGDGDRLEALCALLFNVQGMLLEVALGRNERGNHA